MGVCEVSGKTGEEANKGKRDMTRGRQLFQGHKDVQSLEPRVFA